MTTHLNLLPMKFRRGQIARRRLRQWCMVWLACGALMSSVGWARWNRSRQLNDRLMTLEEEFAPVRRMQDELRRLRRELEEVKRREALVLELAERQPMLTLFGLMSRAAAECGGNVAVLEVTFHRTMEAGATGEEESPGVLVLEGVGVDNLAIARFAAAFRSSDLFREVHLKSTQEVVMNTNPAKAYHLECKF